MDPYLEGEMWQEFHETLAGAIRQQLMPELKPKYVALLAKRYVVDRPTLGILQPPARIVYPDVHVVRPAGPAVALRGRAAGLAIMEPTVVLPSLTLDELPLLSVEIRDVAERRLVTVIEILSPVNKRGEGAREYANRRLELLQTATHLLEIDLLCQGERIQLHGEPPSAPYYIYLSRANRRPYTLVYALSLRNPLPRIPVPLLHPDPDVVLDLQAALDACFELVGYENLLDYRADPPTGHPPEDVAWISSILQSPPPHGEGQ
jgi:hypothetical protein